MTPNEYQQLAARTEGDYGKATQRYSTRDPINGGVIPTKINHAVIGLAGEVGELAGAVEKWLHYGQPLDTVNVAEELGDCLWYIALACNSIGLDLTKVMQGNIAKLKARYPDKYTDERAEEKARDRIEERESIIRTGYLAQAVPAIWNQLCEVCGKEATAIVHDVSRDESVEESHYFCRDHSRPANILPNKTQEQ